MCLQIKLSRIRECKYYRITSTTFGTGTQTIRHVDFPISANFSLPGKLSKNIFISKESSIIKLSSDICIYFALEKELVKIVILKKHAETMRSILNS